MGLTLVSISKLDAAGYAALFHGSCCKIFNAKKKVLGVIPVNKGLYAVNAPQKLFVGIVSVDQPLTMEEVHAQLGHIAPKSIWQMLKADTITSIKLDPAHSTMGSCEFCKYVKATQKPIGKVRDPPRCAKLGEEVHTNLWGPSPVKTNAQSKYFASFTDDHTHFTNLYLLKTKDQTFNTYQKYEAWIGTQFEMKVKHLHLD
ncbi:hypothetical protein ID866_13293 [Astraeus odoratus]|nr:hypothetical protein ID866_13293 [Astraeus odoratus]